MSMVRAHIVVEEDHSISGTAPGNLPAGEYDVPIPINEDKQIDLSSALKSENWGSPVAKYSRMDIYQESETKWDRLYGR